MREEELEIAIKVSFFYQTNSIQLFVRINLIGGNCWEWWSWKKFNDSTLL